MKLFLNIIKFVVVILILYIGLNIYVKSKKRKSKSTKFIIFNYCFIK